MRWEGLIGGSRPPRSNDRMPRPEQSSYVTPIEHLNDGAELVWHPGRNTDDAIVIIIARGSRKHGAQEDMKVLVQAVRYTLSGPRVRLIM